MALVYCELCGVLIKGDQGSVEVPEGVICDGCFQARRATVTAPEPPQPAQPDLVQFACCYCSSLLRLPTVARRTRVRCPSCDDVFYLHADGRIESKLEGNRTAIIQKDQVVPPLGDEGSKPGGEGMKTQPLKRSDVSPDASPQRAMLEELKPKKLEFVEGLPERQANPVIDTSRYEDAAPPPAARDPSLRPSEEGSVDLDADGLRRKTDRFKAGGAAPAGRSGKAGAPRRGASSAGPARPRAKKKARAPDPDADEERRRREARRAAATQGGRELASERSRQTLRTVGLWALLVGPALLFLGLSVTTSRGRGFATRGKLGEGLQSLGEGVDHAVRSLNELLPAAVRLDVPEEDT